MRQNSIASFHPYYSFLLDSREILVMPMTNAWGYFKKQYNFYPEV